MFLVDQFVVCVIVLMRPYNTRFLLVLTQQNMEENRDERFVKNAAEDNMDELQLLNLIGSKAMSKELRKAAADMRGDHEKVAAQVAEYAAAHNITIEVDTMNDSHDLADNKAGTDWDRKALNELVDDHESAVKRFENATSDVNDAGLRTWTVNTLPVLQKHLAMLKEMQGRMK